MDQRLILNKIQVLLKSKGTNYFELSQRMGLSHQAVKRFFAKGQITFENLLKICQILDLSLSDFFYEVEQETMKVFKFPPEQELFLANNPNYLAYFYQIRAKKTPSQIRQIFKLSEKSNVKYLKKLRGFGLIEFDGENFVSKVNAPLFWEDSGPLGQVFSIKMITELVERSISPKDHRKRPYLDLKNLVLSKNQHDSLLNEIEKVLGQYQSLSTQNSKLKKASYISYSSLFLLGEREMNLFNEIFEI